jgi:hypothetical protein
MSIKAILVAKTTKIYKIFFSILLISIYTYIIVFFTAAHMLKVTSANDILSYTTMQMVMESNKSIESFLNFQIKSSIDLVEQEYSIFSNPMDLYYLLTMPTYEICDTFIKDSNNTDIRKFIENSCEGI